MATREGACAPRSEAVRSLREDQGRALPRQVHIPKIRFTGPWVRIPPPACRRRSSGPWPTRPRV
jgi:hypothetical protein